MDYLSDVEARTKRSNSSGDHHRGTRKQSIVICMELGTDYSRTGTEFRLHLGKCTVHHPCSFIAIMYTVKLRKILDLSPVLAISSRLYCTLKFEVCWLSE